MSDRQKASQGKRKAPDNDPAVPCLPVYVERLLERHADNGTPVPEYLQQLVIRHLEYPACDAETLEPSSKRQRTRGYSPDAIPHERESNDEPTLAPRLNQAMEDALRAEEFTYDTLKSLLNSIVALNSVFKKLSTKTPLRIFKATIENLLDDDYEDGGGSTYVSSFLAKLDEHCREAEVKRLNLN